MSPNFISGSCDDLQEAANATASDYVVGQLASGGVSCDSWTSFEINNNRLKLIAANDAASNDVFVFNNVRFVIGESGILRVSPSAEFTGADGSSQVRRERAPSRESLGVVTSPLCAAAPSHEVQPVETK